MFCKYGDYFLEIDTKADTHYDANGAGRIHKKGAPGAICIAAPFTKTPSYRLDTCNAANFSICGGIKTENGFVHGYDEDVEYILIKKEVTDAYVKAKLECRKDGKALFCETYTVSDGGAELLIEGDGEMEIVFPAFEFDGETGTEISVGEKTVRTDYKGYRCIYETDSIIEEKNMIYANRSGHYRAMRAFGKDKISLKICIEKICRA